MGRRKKCPNPSCTFEYTNKVTVCPECSAQIDSSQGDVPVKIPVVKSNKSVPKSKHPTVYLGDGVFSVQYWMYNRCFVRMKTDMFDTGEETNFCTKFDCSEKRALSIRNNSQFDCAHIQKVIKEMLKQLVIKT